MPKPTAFVEDDEQRRRNQLYNSIRKTLIWSAAGHGGGTLTNDSKERLETAVDDIAENIDLADYDTGSLGHELALELSGHGGDLPEPVAEAVDELYGRRRDILVCHQTADPRYFRVGYGGERGRPVESTRTRNQ
ncbi:MAG: hypothetical protein ABEN55_08710 [Bradymonadaceae bacterium]